MNTEEKELKLKDMLPRTQYGVMVNRLHFPIVDEEGCIEGSELFENHEVQTYEIEMAVDDPECVIILFPIECLTKPITIAVNGNVQTICIKDYIIEEHGEAAWNGISFLVQNGPDRLPVWFVDLCRKFHVNLFLPAHLFVPVTETFNPYK